jgi:hypothetical protein
MPSVKDDASIFPELQVTTVHNSTRSTSISSFPSWLSNILCNPNQLRISNRSCFHSAPALSNSQRKEWPQYNSDLLTTHPISPFQPSSTFYYKTINIHLLLFTLQPILPPKLISWFESSFILSFNHFYISSFHSIHFHYTDHLFQCCYISWHVYAQLFEAFETFLIHSISSQTRVIKLLSFTSHCNMWSNCHCYYYLNPWCLVRCSKQRDSNCGGLISSAIIMKKEFLCSLYYPVTKTYCSTP